MSVQTDKERYEAAQGEQALYECPSCTNAYLFARNGNRSFSFYSLVQSMYGKRHFHVVF